MTLLSLAQDAADELGIVRPSTVIGNAAAEVRKLLRYANKEGRQLRRRGDWQQLRSEQSFTAVATEAQTSTMVPSDLDHFCNETFWNRTRKRMFNGPLAPRDWQALKATTGSVINETFSYRGNIFYISPVPTAGDSFRYEYISTKFCASAAGTAQAAWTADTDTARLDEELFTLGIIWRYKKGEGMPWADDFAEYEAQVQTALRLESPKRTLNMAHTGRRPGPGIVVPEGSWSP
ncbi:MAG TPA: hypothetical protein VEA41_22650 [Salinarimonas sp.]|nr:hypothetical protein [Salinarimonas sp.]